MDKFFDRLAEDLETYAAHAKRKTIEVEDVELLLKRYEGRIQDFLQSDVFNVIKPLCLIKEEKAKLEYHLKM